MIRNAETAHPLLLPRSRILRRPNPIVSSRHPEREINPRLSLGSNRIVPRDRVSMKTVPPQLTQQIIDIRGRSMQISREAGWRRRKRASEHGRPSGKRRLWAGPARSIASFISCEVRIIHGASTAASHPAMRDFVVPAFPHIRRSSAIYSSLELALVTISVNT